MIEQAIELAVKSLRLGMHPNAIKLALISNHISLDRADTIVRWAQRKMEKKK
jgi:hypothetical protein